MRIVIETIPHAKQRIPGLGDYFWEGDTLQINVSSTGTFLHDMLIAIHELVEFAITCANGVSTRDIDNFDKAHPETMEPGDLLNCPYGFEHSTATGIERIVAAACGIKWADYEDNLDFIMENAKSDA